MRRLACNGLVAIFSGRTVGSAEGAGRSVGDESPQRNAGPDDRKPSTGPVQSCRYTERMYGAHRVGFVRNVACPMTLRGNDFPHPTCSFVVIYFT